MRGATNTASAAVLISDVRFLILITLKVYDGRAVIPE